MVVTIFSFYMINLATINYTIQGIIMIKALQKKYEAEIEAAKANIQVYLDNPAGIGEHSDLVSAVDEQMSKLAEAEDKLETLTKHYL